MEPQLHQLGADHDGRELRDRRPRPLLRAGRGPARRRAEPPPADRRHGRDGTARRALARLVSDRKRDVFAGDGRRRSAPLRPRPVRRLPRRRGVAPAVPDRDLLRDAPGDRQLALVGGAVLHPGRQVPAASHGDRGTDRLQGRRRRSVLPPSTTRAPSPTRSSCASIPVPGRGCACRPRRPRSSRLHGPPRHDLRHLERRSPTAYEVLLHAAIVGRPSHFTRQDSVEETWRILQPLLDAPPPVEQYAQGSWGPASADRLVAGVRRLARAVAARVMRPARHTAPDGPPGGVGPVLGRCGGRVAWGDRTATRAACRRAACRVRKEAR